MLRQLGGTFVGSISPRAFLSLSLPFSLGLGVSERAAQLGNRFRLTLSPILYPYTVKPGKVNYVASVLSTQGRGANEVQTPSFRLKKKQSLQTIPKSLACNGTIHSIFISKQICNDDIEQYRNCTCPHKKSAS